MILVTGGAGFIGLNFIYSLLQYTDHNEIVNLDALTYASNRALLPKSNRHVLIQGDINDRNLVNFLLKQQPETIVHFAAESHVDTSIKWPSRFMNTNANGTYNLLECVREHCPETLFVHVSTDEVYGELGEDDAPFTENHPYRPNSPYSATKAASDLLVRAWSQTFGLRTIITHSSNNYGPLQFPEKLIPLTITRALEEKNLPVYGNGRQIRDWIHVADHCSALRYIIDHGQVGETYNIGARNEMTNISVVHKICQILDEVKPREDNRSYAELIEFVTDRPGHDQRYALDTTKLNNLGWTPKKNFDEELKNLITGYL